MTPTHLLRRWTIGWLAVFIAFLAPLAAPAVDELSGRYAISGHNDTRSYGGELAIRAQGFAYDVSWTREGGQPESGLGLTLNHVLGVAYWPKNEVQEPGIGTVIYQIDGGRLDGIWLPEHASNRTPGREVLSGSPDLTGRYAITLGVNPGGRSNYTGYADLERSGDHFKVVWHTPAQVFVGSGIKMGRVLVVAYAYAHYPAVAAYCSNGHQLEGFWWLGPEGEAGRETLTPAAEGTQLSSMPKSNTHDPCTTPVAANF